MDNVNTNLATAIIAPSFRPLPPGAPISRVRQRLGLALLVFGAAIFLVGMFVSFHDWLFAVGSTVMIAGAFVVGPYWLRRHTADDFRKLYRQH